MTFTYDTLTNTGRMRLLATDTDSTRPIFEDGEIDVFLALNGGEILLAAAQALDTIASNEALVQKRITILGLSTDGPATAKALRDGADRLRRQYETGLGSDEVAFATAEFADGAFSDAERMTKAMQREGL